MKAECTAVHEFIKSLHDRRRLLRCYTQNIDCLEQRLGLEESSDANRHAPMVLLHGSLNSVICTLCKAKGAFDEEMRRIFQEGVAPPCGQCQEKNAIRVAAQRRPIAVTTNDMDIIFDDWFILDWYLTTGHYPLQ